MRIGVVANGSQADRVIAQAQRAEEDGFATRGGVSRRIWPRITHLPRTPAANPGRGALD